MAALSIQGLLADRYKGTALAEDRVWSLPCERELWYNAGGGLSPIPAEESAMKELPCDTKMLAETCRHNDISLLGVFGSVARGEATERSEVDLLVRFSRRKSLLELIGVEREFSTILGREVDLQTEAAISPCLRDRVKADLRVIYGA